jgi:diguanylate cyclase (GGDEF)-like protein
MLLEDIICRYFEFLESKGKTFNVALGILWTALFGALDILAPGNASFSFLYLFPIAFVTWFGGKRAGFVISLVCAALWSIDNVVDKSIVSAWNMLSTVAIFGTVSVMISKIHKLLKRERKLSRRDPLTGVMNVRAFSEIVEYEILRINRSVSPFSVAYLDLDNFKSVNDLYGHKKGDELLKAVVTNLARNLRQTDVIARVGGDEFAIFLPSTDHIEVKVVMDKIRKQLQKLMENLQRTVTFSMGVLTCDNSEYGFDEIISMADRLMYEVKNSGKNNIRYSTLPLNNDKEC